ncbi:hypothetical protein RNJ44_04036 [Nakaseomyces bracarensis]|uniref:Uncharacterized protein n=1 Tax=Nakaseomyces bracarensis TaxID=273131 RepID=A0ABR4NTR4_9SACH
MEKLGSLESSLPPEQPPTKQAIASLNGELMQEFKFAANSVTKLYRLANEKTSLVRHQGYVRCVEDLLSLIDDSNGKISVEDIRQWCEMHRNEKMLGGEDTKTEIRSNACTNDSAGDRRTASDNKTDNSTPKLNFNLKENYLGKSATDSKTDGLVVPTFRLSKPPLSVEHTNRTRRRYVKRYDVNETTLNPTQDEHNIKKPRI